MPLLRNCQINYQIGDCYPLKEKIELLARRSPKGEGGTPFPHHFHQKNRADPIFPI